MSIDPFDAAVAEARALLRDDMDNGLTRAIRGLTDILDGDANKDEAKQVVAAAWALLRYEYLTALDHMTEEEEVDDEEESPFQDQNGRLWEAIHEAAGAMIEGRPSGIKHAMDDLERWWRGTR